MDMVVTGNRVYLGLAPQAAKGAGENDPVVILVKRTPAQLFVAVDGFSEPFTG